MSCSKRLSDDESVISAIKARHLLIDGAIPASVIGKNFLFFSTMQNVDNGPTLRWPGTGRHCR
jgi:hypothetical protein